MNTHDPKGMNGDAFLSRRFQCKSRSTRTVVPGSFTSIKADKMNLVYPLNSTSYQSHKTLESAFSLDRENLKSEIFPNAFQTFLFLFITHSLFKYKWQPLQKKHCLL